MGLVKPHSNGVNVLAAARAQNAAGEAWELAGRACLLRRPMRAAPGPAPARASQQLLGAALVTPQGAVGPGVGHGASWQSQHACDAYTPLVRALPGSCQQPDRAAQQRGGACAHSGGAAAAAGAGGR